MHGVMVSALVSEGSGPGSSPDRGHTVVFLRNTLYLDAVISSEFIYYKLYNDYNYIILKLL